VASVCQAEQPARVVGHVQTVGDSGQHVEGRDSSATFGTHDDADLALRHADGNADAGLTGSSVLPHQAKQRASVAFLKRRKDIGALPESGGYSQRVEDV
jgi:hypothetical protein